MQKFAEREVYKQGANEKQVGIEQNSDPLGNDRVKSEQAYCQFFYVYQIDSEEIAHQDSGHRNTQKQKKREVIGG